MIISLYCIMLCLYLLSAIGTHMPDWLIILSFVLCAILYWVAELRYCRLKKRVEDLENYKKLSIEWWEHQIRINDKIKAALNSLVEVEE